MTSRILRDEAARIARATLGDNGPSSYAPRDVFVLLIDALTPILAKNAQATECLRALTVDRDATQEAFEKMGARVVELEKALFRAEVRFRDYGDLHAAKPDMEKARRNYSFADELRIVLKPEEQTVVEGTRAENTRAAIIRYLEALGWTEGGGGDDFVLYTRPGCAECPLYVYDDGLWAYHNLDVQENDNRENAWATGSGADDLRMFLETLK